MRIHPYALIIGLVLGVMVLFTLRHPLFALLTTAVATLGFDLLLKKPKDEDK